MRGQAANQLDLFSRPRLDVLPFFKSALAEALKASDLSREQIAERTNELMQSEGLRSEVTAAKLSKWAAPSDTTHVPSIRVLPFLFMALNDASPLEALLAPLGVRLCGPREQKLIELAEGRMAAKKAAKKIKQAEQALEGM
jgi:hypothetical protein